MVSIFQPERADETVIFEVRRHWIALVPPFLTALALLIIVLVGEYLMGRYASEITATVPLAALQAVALVLALLSALILFIGWYIYDHTRLVLTNMHIVQITQAGLFSRSVSQLNLESVQDVTTRKNGILATILNFGDVIVETAAEKEYFVFGPTANSAGLAESVMHACDKVEGHEVPI